jgi:hypothetical protein
VSCGLLLRWPPPSLLSSRREAVTFLDCFTVNKGWVPHSSPFLA